MLTQLHQALLVAVRHDAAQRVLQVRHHHHGLDVVVGLQGQVQSVDGDAGLRAGGNLQGAQAQAFQHLQQAVKRGRLHGDGVARLGHGPQRQVQGLNAAIGDLHVTRRHRHTQRQGAFGQHGAELGVALGR